MDIGIFSNVAGTGSLASIVADARASAEAGFASYWLPQIVQQAEAMNIIGAAAQHVEGIRFGTSVVPTYPRHPMVMAEQAMTTSMLTAGASRSGSGCHTSRWWRGCGATRSTSRSAMPVNTWRR